MAGLGRREWRYGCGVVVGYLERERRVLEREVRKNGGEREGRADHHEEMKKGMF